MRLLWLSPRWPFPADDGAKQASAALLLALAELGHEIHVLTFAREKDLAPPTHPGIRLLAHHRAPRLGLTRALRNLAGRLPVSAAPFAGYGLTWENLRALLPGDPSAVVIDGDHAYASFVGQACPWPMIYRAHNFETELWEKAAASYGFLLRPYFRLQAARMRRFEGNLGRAVRAVAAISETDAAAFRAWLPQTRVAWVPMGFRFAPPPAFAPGPLTLGFLGRLDWPPNREGLAWFLEKIWPEVRRRRPEARLLVAGSGAGDWLRRYPAGLFEWRGRLAEVEPFYAEIHGAVVPMRLGSGTKIKLVEAARFGRAIFSTSHSLEGGGIPAQATALVADEPVAWIEAISRAAPAELARFGERAFTEAARAFEARAAAERFLALLS